MKTPSKEDCPLNEPKCWAIDCNCKPSPQSVEVMTLEDIAHAECREVSHSPFTAYIAGATQFKAKSEALQAELDKYRWIPVEPRTEELTDRMSGCDSRLVQCLFDTGEILAFNDDHPFAVMTHVCFLPELPSAVKKGGEHD